MKENIFWGGLFMKQSTYLICTFILGISIIMSAFIFSNTFSNFTNQVNNAQTTMNSFPDLMTTMQLSEYLQISEESIEKIIKEDNLEKQKLGSYDTYRFIPYLIINKQERFLKEEIDKWLEYKNHHQ
jgi:hypothetical protein